MLATTSPPHFRPGWGYELKYDGHRMLASKWRNRVTLISRNRKDATKWFPQIVAGLQEIPGSFLLDGEACALDTRGYPDFEALRGIIRRPQSSGMATAYYAFDLLTLRGRDLRSRQFVDRKEALYKLISQKERIKSVEHLVARGAEFYEAALAMKLEGIVAKRLTHAYTAGRSQDWLKFKAPNYHDGWKRQHGAR
jgi:bifunctional non-homologous end joining protein LigD